MKFSIQNILEDEKVLLYWGKGINPSVKKIDDGLYFPICRQNLFLCWGL